MDCKESDTNEQTHNQHTLPEFSYFFDFLAIRFVASLWQLTLPWWAVWWLWDHWFGHLSLQKVGDEGRMDLHWSSSSLPPRMERVQVSHLTGFPPVCLASLFPSRLLPFFSSFFSVSPSFAFLLKQRYGRQAWLHMSAFHPSDSSLSNFTHIISTDSTWGLSPWTFRPLLSHVPEVSMSGK